MSNYIERYWRDAVPADAIKEPPMMARFRDDEKYAWRMNLLRGIRQGAEFPWFSECKGSFEQCQVYDAPDPGEGWRLIDTENEEPQEGDEIYDLTSRRWIQRSYPFTSWVTSLNRRRIETPKPKYVPFEWQDREQLRGRWLQRKTGHVTEELIATKFETGRRGLIVNGIYGADLLLKQWTFLDTGEPVGRRIG